MTFFRMTGYILLSLFIIAAANALYKNSLIAAEDHHVSYGKAEVLFKREKFAEALSLYETILLKHPFFISAYRGLITCYNKLGDPQGAVIFIESLFFENPESAEVCYGLGYALYSVKKYNESRIYFEKAIKLNPNLAEAWNNCAAIFHFILHDYETAREYYAKAISISERTDNDRVLKIAQENLAHLPQRDVIQPIKKALSLEEFVNRFITSVDQKDEKEIKGLVLGQKENCEKAMDWLLREALRAYAEEKKDEKTAILLAKLLEKRYRESFSSSLLANKLDAYMCLSDENKLLRIKGEKLLEEGLIKEKNGEYSDASINYKKALSSFQKINDKSNSGLSNSYLGDVYFKMKNFSLARRAYADALRFFAETGEEERRALVLSALGKTCFESGNYKDALGFFEQSLATYRLLKDGASEKKIQKNIEYIKDKIKEKSDKR